MAKRKATIRKDKLVEYMAEVHLNALLHSKDKSTKVGSGIYDPKSWALITSGFNGFPRNVREDIPERLERPLKYDFVEHAERNGLYNLARKHFLQTTAITTKTPTLDGIRALVSVGIREVFMPYSKDGLHAVAQALLEESNVKVHYFDEAHKTTIPGDPRRERKINDLIHESFVMLKMPNVKDTNPDYTIFIDDSYTVLSRGYSGFPRGSDDSKTERYTDPLERERWVESSVCNAVFNKIRPDVEGKIGLVSATTCIVCARAYAGVGLKNVAYMAPNQDFINRWGKSIKDGVDMMKNLGIHTIEVPREEVQLKIEEALQKFTLERAKDLLGNPVVEHTSLNNE